MFVKKIKQKWILLLILFLVVAIGATTVIYVDRMREFLPNDEGAISLTDAEERIADDIDGKKEDIQLTEETEVSDSENGDVNGSARQRVLDYKPASTASDYEQVWDEKTEVEIFKISYANNQQEITVRSDNGEKVVAPGTENSYTFKLKNTGNVALDYEVSMNLFTGLSETKIPLECRVYRYDGTWIAGDETEWVSIAKLNDVVDIHSVGAGRYTTYTLDWRWPFESGSDELDTSLGKSALKQDVTFTLIIDTTAEISGNPDVSNGIIPETGDNSNSTLYVVLMTASVLVILLLLWFREREEEIEYE